MPRHNLLPGIHNRFRQASGLEQREAQQHRVSHDAPDASDNVIRECDRLDQHRIDSDTDHDQESLEAKGHQGSQIVLTDMALLPVPEGGERDRCQARHEVDLHHTAIDDHEDRNGQDRGTYLDDKGLQEQSEQFSQFHCLQTLPYGLQRCRIDRRRARDQACAGIDHVLGDIEDCHDDIEGVGDQHDRHEGLEDPFEEDPGFKVCQVVVFDDQLNQLIAGDERQEHACDGNDDRFGDIPHQGENPRRKTRRGAPDL